MSGNGQAVARAPLQTVRAALLDPARLMLAIPGAMSVERLGADSFEARLSLGVGPFRSAYSVKLVFAERSTPFIFDLSGESTGRAGTGRATGLIRIAEETPKQTMIDWSFAGHVAGPVSLVGGRILRGSAHLFCGRFFERLTRGLS